MIGLGGLEDPFRTVAALCAAERPGPAAKVVRLMCDSGRKYLDTDLFATL